MVLGTCDTVLGRSHMVLRTCLMVPCSCQMVPRRCLKVPGRGHMVLRRCHLALASCHMVPGWAPILEYFGPWKNILICFLTLLIFKYIWIIALSYDQNIFANIFSAFFLSSFSQNVISKVHIFHILLLALNIFEYLLKLWPKTYLTICLWRFQSFKYIHIYVWWGFSFSNILEYSTIFSYLGRSSVIFDDLQQSSVIPGELWQSLVIFWDLRQSLAIFGDLWQSLAIFGFL